MCLLENYNIVVHQMYQKNYVRKPFVWCTIKCIVIIIPPDPESLIIFTKMCSVEEATEK